MDGVSAIALRLPALSAGFGCEVVVILEMCCGGVVEVVPMVAAAADCGLRGANAGSKRKNQTFVKREETTFLFFSFSNFFYTKEINKKQFFEWFDSVIY